MKTWQSGSITLICTAALCSAAFAQDNNSGRPGAAAAEAGRLPGAEALIETIAMPALDFQAIAVEDQLNDEMGMAPRYAIPYDALYTPDNSGNWERVGADTLVWRLRITAPNAVSVNLGFTGYHMPAGGQLVFRATDNSINIRPFTENDNAPHGELWTPPLHVNDVMIEVTLPAHARRDLHLELGSINLGYRKFGEAVGRSGACNIDVICPEGDDWLDEISSVGVISTGGSTFCTGFMVNNTAGDQTPYFMTAAHCGINSGNAASLVVYWNFETSVCGGTPDGVLSDFQTGSFFRSAYSPSDFTLVELDSDPDPAHYVGFSGWDRSGVDATSAIAIHHPNTDEKRISFEYQPTTVTSYLGEPIPGDGTHVRVEDWDLGTTEPGSSGSPLFDQNHRIIGQLHGGYASCSSQTSDWYGRIYTSWTGGGSSSTRLSDWLDPAGTGATSVDTISPFGPSPPNASAASLSTGVDVALNITLLASDSDGLPGGPLQYKIISLPASGNTVADMGNGHVILSGELPYTLVSNGNQVTYTPTGGFYGGDGFQFIADDGGTPPDGGDSDPATISVSVQFGPPVITTNSLPDGSLGYPYGPVQIQVDQGQPALTHDLITNEYVEVDLGYNGFYEVGVDQNWNADDSTWTYALPFTFTFFQNGYTSCWISSNGFIDFASSASDYSNTTQELIDNVRIAPQWDDWETDCAADSDIYIDESVSGEVTIRWDVQHFSCADAGDFSVTLVNDGTIRFNYGPTNTGLTPTIGISGGDGTHYLLSVNDGAGSLPNANTMELYPPVPLPAGMTFSPSGELGGTPTELGTFEPRFRVTDGLNRSDVQQLTLVIDNLVPTCPEDLDGLNGVGQGDLNMVLNRWGDPACDPGGAANPCLEDLDGLNGVGQGDLNMVLNRWGDPACD